MLSLELSKPKMLKLRVKNLPSAFARTSHGVAGPVAEHPGRGLIDSDWTSGFQAMIAIT